jgi:hypothetical protein
VQGRSNGTYRLGILLSAFLVAGCDLEEGAEELQPSPPATLGQEFDPAKTGTLKVRVVWEGKVPTVEKFVSYATPIKEPPHPPARKWPNPFAPIVDATSGGLAEVVVLLRGVDLERSKPWDLPTVRVVMKDYAMKVHQGDRVSKTGFVRRGEAVEMTSLDEPHYAIQGRNDAFFTYHFPTPNQPRNRTLTETGQVALRGGLGRFWMQSTLYVTDHPYVALTNREGIAVLEQVPEGDYQVVLCHPRWQVNKVEYDPNWGDANRLFFHPPLEWSHSAHIRPGKTEVIEEAFSEARFTP